MVHSCMEHTKLDTVHFDDDVVVHVVVMFYNIDRRLFTRVDQNTDDRERARDARGGRGARGDGGASPDPAGAEYVHSRTPARVQGGARAPRRLVQYKRIQILPSLL